MCISDYYASVESGQIDTVPLQIVTVGQVATQQFDKLQSANEYTKAYFFHGLAVQAAEATANYVNKVVINRELGIAENRGKRYSWGYPACPDLSDHQTVLKLLPNAESEPASCSARPTSGFPNRARRPSSCITRTRSISAWAWIASSRLKRRNPAIVRYAAGLCRVTLCNFDRGGGS